MQKYAPPDTISESNETKLFRKLDEVNVNFKLAGKLMQFP